MACKRGVTDGNAHSYWDRRIQSERLVQDPVEIRKVIKHRGDVRFGRDVGKVGKSVENLGTKGGLEFRARG